MFLLHFVSHKTFTDSKKSKVKEVKSRALNELLLWRRTVKKQKQLSSKSCDPYQPLSLSRQRKIGFLLRFLKGFLLSRIMFKK